MMRWWKYPFDQIDRFLFQGCDPRIVPIFRIGFAILILIQVGVLWNDAGYWFADAGVLTTESAKRSIGDNRWSLFFVLPATAITAKIGLGLMAGHAMLMLLGIASRIQAAAIFIWLVSFQNRNTFIHDGEDAVFRLWAFLMVWLPLDCAWSCWNRRRADRSEGTLRKESAWGLRLIQIEMTAIYASTALCKMQGNTWWNGSAVWIVSKMQDNYGRLIPGEFFDLPWISPAATWGTLLVEFALPVALWVRPIRNYAVLAGIALLLGIEFSMNLFLFQWVMMLGLLAFIDLDRFPFRRRVRVQSNLA
ncbi:MAG: HTTM domain-containing protein [Planctomycetota bacterium]